MSHYHTTELYCDRLNSDKTYATYIKESSTTTVDGTRRYSVTTAHGRRGSTLRQGKGLEGDVSLREANRFLQSVLKEKKAKGYQLVSEQETAGFWTSSGSDPRATLKPTRPVEVEFDAQSWVTSVGRFNPLTTAF